MDSFANTGSAASQRPPSAQEVIPGARPAPPPTKPGSDVKPRLTKDQHDILERHFQQHHKPSTSTKKGFAETLGVPLDKINNWFQNRRAKVKQDVKKQMNAMNMQMGLYSQPQMPGAPQFSMSPAAPVALTHYARQIEQTQLSAPQPFFSPSADISPASRPAQAQIPEGTSPMDIGPSQHPAMAQPFDMHHNLRSIPEADRGTSYHPNAVMNSFMAATAGSSYMHSNAVSMQPQDSNFGFKNELQHGLPSVLTSAELSALEDAFDDDQYHGFGDYLSYLPMISTAPNDLKLTTGTLSADGSPYSCAPSNETAPSSTDLSTGLSVSLASRFSGWTDCNGDGEAKQDTDTDEYLSGPYNMPQASGSDFWPAYQIQEFPPGDIYQHSNTSAQAVFPSPHQTGRSLSTGPTDFEHPNFGDDRFPRRNSSTSNLANNIEAIHIQSRTPEGFHSPTQSSIATRRQKRPTALNSNTLRSASYSGSSMPSPGSTGDHTLRRIRSSGIGHPGRVQKPQPASAQRSPMSQTFSEAASSPKFQRAMSSSSLTTLGQNINLAPPTPQTPNETGRFPSWQNNPAVKNPSSLQGQNSPEGLSAQWSMEQNVGVFANGESPPSFDAAQTHQARLGEMYRETPPQSAPPKQPGFPPQSLMQPPKLRAAFHSSADLTLQQPKPNHVRRPSLPADAQGQVHDPNALFASGYGGFNYDDFKDYPLSGIQHNVPFAPPVSAMPDFLVNHYVPPPGDGVHGHMRKSTAPEARSYIFANQGPRDFRS